MTATPEEVYMESLRARRLQRAVDVSVALLRQGVIAPANVPTVLHTLRGLAEELCPGTREAFDLIYAPRVWRAAVSARASVIVK